MRVAYICADPGIPVFGTKGASIHIQEILRAFLKRGDKITLVAQRIGDVPEEFSDVKVYALPPLPAKANAEERARASLSANEHIIRQLEEAGPFDLVYERYSLWSAAGMTYARQTGVTGILEVNAPLIEEQDKYRKLPLKDEGIEILKRVTASADTIIAVSPGVKNWLETYEEAKGRVHVVANGVDPKRFLPKHAQDKDVPVIGFLGTLKPWHGVHTLVEAFELLHEHKRQVQLSIVGDGPEFDALHQRLEEKGLLSFVQFSGAVEPKAVPELLANMDIAIAPYPDLEGFYFSPLKIYEYMAAGLPVITTTVGHLPEVVAQEETGLLIKPDDGIALCTAIERLLDDLDLRQKLGEAGRLQVEKSHSWDSVLNRILGIAGIA